MSDRQKRRFWMVLSGLLGVLFVCAIVVPFLFLGTHADQASFNKARVETIMEAQLAPLKQEVLELGKKYDKLADDITALRNLLQHYDGVAGGLNAELSQVRITLHTLRQDLERRISDLKNCGEKKRTSVHPSVFLMEDQARIARIRGGDR